MDINTAIKIKGIFHIAIIPENMDASLERYWKDVGIGPWHLATLGAGAERVRLHGKPASLAVRAAFTHIGPLMIALDYPLSKPNPYEGILRRKGGGAHHLAFVVDRLDEAGEKMRHFGYPEISCMSGIGPTGDGSGAYYDAIDQLGTVIELAELPREMPAADGVYPSGPAVASSKIKGLGFHHVGIVVRDAEKTAKLYESRFGIGPWEIRTLGSREEGMPLPVKQALVRVGPILLALEQPLGTHGALKDFLDENGQGIHHVCVTVDAFQQAAGEMRRLGYEQLEAACGAGTHGDGEAAYFDTSGSFGMFMEVSGAHA